MQTQPRVAAVTLCAFAAVLMLGIAPVHAQGFWPWSWGNKPKPQPPAQEAPAPKNSTPAPRTQGRSGPPTGGGTYRTLCVRTCDGFYFPINFKVGRSKFQADNESCQQRCGADARLFVHRNPGQQLSSAVDLEGKRYVDLENAFRYRKQLVPGCECRPGSLSETPGPETGSATPQFETTTHEGGESAPASAPENETVIGKTP